MTLYADTAVERWVPSRIDRAVISLKQPSEIKVSLTVRACTFSDSSWLMMFVTAYDDFSADKNSVQMNMLIMVLPCLKTAIPSGAHCFRRSLGLHKLLHNEEAHPSSLSGQALRLQETWHHPYGEAYWWQHHVVGMFFSGRDWETSQDRGKD